MVEVERITPTGIKKAINKVIENAISKGIVPGKTEYSKAELECIQVLEDEIVIELEPNFGDPSIWDGEHPIWRANVMNINKGYIYQIDFKDLGWDEKHCIRRVLKAIQQALDC